LIKAGQLPHSMLCVWFLTTGPATCDNPPNNLPGYTWPTTCNTGTAAVLSTCTGGCNTSAGYTAAGGNSITATCNIKGVYNVTEQCIGSREWRCPAVVYMGCMWTMPAVISAMLVWTAQPHQQRQSICMA
jgi:hypothetical protein